MDELIDFVDEDDRVIGQGMKYVAHQQGLWHRSVGLFVFSDKKKTKLLLTKRAAHIYKGGMWCIPGGHVGAGESYEDAAQREYQEELYNQHSDNNASASINDNANDQELVLHYLFSLKKSVDNDKEIIHTFSAIDDGSNGNNSNFSPNPDEVSAWEFRSIHEVMRQVREESDTITDTSKVLLLEYEKKYLQ